MATIKKISGLSDAGTLTTTYRLLVEDSSGNLKSTTVGAVNTHTHTWSEVTGKPSTFTPASHTQGEATLTWGGKNFSGTYGPVDASMIPELGANRLAFGNPAGITIEYSRDGGSTWTDYGADNNSKVNLFSPPGAGFSIGKADSTNKATADYLLRVTISTGSFGVYTALNKFMIYCSTNGSTGSYCSIDAALESTPTTFVNFANKVPISGWSGYNIINTSSITTYGNSASNQYGRLRFTFGCTGGSTTYSGLNIVKIYGFGGVGWTAPSNLARTGHIYSIGTGQSAVFPGSVTANGGFSGSLNGNATTATKLGTTTVGSASQPIYLNGGAPTAIGYTIETSVPKNALFTDHTYSLVGAQNTTGLVKNGSSVTSVSDYTACPIVSGIPYYKDTNTTSVSANTTGTGNAVTAVSASGSVITVTKGATFLTEHQNISGKEDKSNKVKSWSATVTDDHYPSEKLVKDALDAFGTIAYKSTTDYLASTGGTVTGVTSFTNSTASTSTTTGAVKISGGLGVVGDIYAGAVHNAVWNDLADCIPVDDECKVEPGYCYCFDGEKYYKSTKYLDEGIIGIDSDTYGMNMGSKSSLNQMDVAVAGFVLAYVDKEYKPGTPLTCTENGYLTEIKKEDKMEYPERIVATYWKSEPADEWGSESRKVRVNGRKWVKVV